MPPGPLHSSKTCSSLQKETPCPLSSSSPFPFRLPPDPGNHQYVFCLMGLLVLNICIWKELIQYVTFCVWLLSLSLLSRFMHVAAHIRTSSFFYGWVISHCLYVPQFIHLLVDGCSFPHLGHYSSFWLPSMLWQSVCRCSWANSVYISNAVERQLL